MKTTTLTFTGTQPRVFYGLPDGIERSAKPGGTVTVPEKVAEHLMRTGFFQRPAGDLDSDVAEEKPITIAAEDVTPAINRKKKRS